jgi:2-oxoisovalerate dehydrogenase E2 component (dihydrolipoyl transacylase)
VARFEFKLPDIGEGIAEAEIVAWHVKVGDQVSEDQQLADMMTDKATVEMESPVAGKVLELAGAVGDQVAIGSVLVVLETVGEAAEAAAPARKDEVALADGLVEETPALEAAQPSLGESERRSDDRRAREDRRAAAREEEDRRKAERRDAEPAPAKAAPAAPAEKSDGKHPVLAAPAVRQRARDLGIDLGAVKSASGRIRHSDLDAYLLYNGGAVSHGRAARRADEQVKVVGLRRRIAENMAEAKRRIPHFTLVEEYDVTELEQARAMMNADRGDNPKLTILPFLIVAMSRTLADYPQINATYDDEAQIVSRSGAVHMGMATQTPNGLMVPVIRNAQGRDVWDLAREILRLSDAARSGKAAREELSGSTITISSLGPMGGIASTPVINRPEVAIVAVNKLEEKPVVVGGKVEIRKRMNLSLSCDHRVVDGWDAANFMQDLKKAIENPLRLLSMQ